MKVRDLMTTELFTLKSDHTLALADDLMGWQRIRHIPVVNRNFELQGLLTHRDLLKVSLSTLTQASEKDRRKLLANVPIREIMNSNVATTTPDTDVREAAAVMIDEKIGCLPVLEGKKLVGIITEADFLTLAWEVDPKMKEGKTVRKYSKSNR